MALVCIALTCHSQFLNKDAVWTIKTVRYGEEPISKFTDIRISEDTVINDTLYSVFNYARVVAVCEDSGIVYYKFLKNTFQIYDEQDTMENILYNFNLGLNDTIHLYIPGGQELVSRDWAVYDVDSVLIDGIAKKRIWLYVVPYSYPHINLVWIEDVGSTYGPLYNITFPEGELTCELYCYSVNNIKLYGKCQTDGLDEVNAPPPNLIFYDAGSCSIRTRLEGDKGYTLNIYSLSGMKILSKELRGEADVYTGSLNPGLYIVELKSANTRQCEKIIVQ